MSFTAVGDIFDVRHVHGMFCHRNPIVDFYAKIENQDMLLCWKLGEGEIQFYHGANEGFAGRKSIFSREILEEVTKVH